ncbi:asparagine synthase (glutamine-hydrolyzing) [Candidatus Poribacteria bacterium]|nr:asparagine synthase (glutamine-hydrolyzing) [Candidatus Poribacteria bacterium]
MCGICGVYYQHPERAIDKNTIQKMCNLMRHRGPDEDGFYLNGNVALGMRRLKIIDLTTGSQPIFNEDGSIAVVFNGEIYNYPDLRQLLFKKGHTFYTKTDTEVIVHLYEEYGEDFLTFLNGMFAIAIWDDRKKQLLLARDRLGEKPLHYSINDEGILFASEMKSILCHPLLKQELDLEAIYYYFTFYYIPAPFTIYKHVKKLPAGHYLTYKNGKATIKKYWDFSYQPDDSKDEAYFADALYERLKESVRLRLVSDVPLGAFLSGGIDSSTIVGVMSTLMDQPVKTFSIGFEESSHNELDYARVVAQHFQTSHHEFIVRPSAIDLVEKLVWHFDEPFGDSSAIPTYLVSKIAREHVTVALSGDGGDELFAGYDRYQMVLQRRKWYRMPQSLRRFVAHQIGDWLPPTARGKEFLQSLALDEFRHFCLGLREGRNRELFSKDFLKSIDGLDAFAIPRWYSLEPSQEYLNPFLFFDTKVYLPDDILVKVDRMSMANSLETRVPFLDHNLVEFAATIPCHLKIRGGISKYILKRSMNKFLPPALLSRGKHGFTLPVDLWFRHELKPLAFDMLSGAGIEESGLFNVDYIEKILKEHLAERKNHKELLWSLLMFQLWYESASTHDH